MIGYKTMGRLRQKGLVLVVSLIMLLAVTLIIVTASNLVQTNLKIVHNMESREMARNAAISAIEELMSSARFTTSPTAPYAALTTCEGFQQKCYDNNLGKVNNIADADIIVRVSEPTCVAVTPVKNSDLDVFNNPAQASCYLPPAVYSMCASSVWEFEAVATDAVTGAEITVRQGLSVLTTINNIDTACPV